MQRTLDVFQRVIMYALLVPVAIIVLHAILAAAGAQPKNPIVRTIRVWADSFTLEVFDTMFLPPSALKTALVSLVFYGVVAVLVVLVFRVLRSVAGPDGGPSKRR